jgi:hypothetical protein
LPQLCDSPLRHDKNQSGWFCCFFRAYNFARTVEGKNES